MHILLIHQAFAALNEAGGTRHYELARCLVERGHRVTIIASHISYLTGKSRAQSLHWLEKQTPEPGITLLRSYTYPAFHRSFVHRVLSFLSFMISSFITGLGVKEVDLVWGTSPPIFQGVTAWLLARLKGVPFLFEIRDLWPAFAIAIGVLRNPLLIRMSLWLERFLYQHADRVIVNSPGFLQHVTERGARRVELIPNGADPEMFHPTSRGTDFRHENGLEDKFVILYAGAHGISNDLGLVLRAAYELRNDPNLMFVFVGDGKEKDRLEEDAFRMGLTNTLFCPPVAKENMAEVMAAADACIAILKPLELYKTTYPNKVFDYMAAGRAVLLVIDGVIRQVVEDAHAGIAIPPGDKQSLVQAVQQMAADPECTRAMGASGRAYIEMHFNRRTLAEKLAALIEEMQASQGRNLHG